MTAAAPARPRGPGQPPRPAPRPGPRTSETLVNCSNGF